MIPKPNKDPTIPRPISLLNLNIKMYAKVIALRLDILPTLIHPDQVGFIKGRQAPDATRRMLYILCYVEIHKLTTFF